MRSDDRVGGEGAGTGTFSDPHCVLGMLGSAFPTPVAVAPHIPSLRFQIWISGFLKGLIVNHVLVSSGLMQVVLLDLRGWT